MKSLLKGTIRIATMLAVCLFTACGDDDKEEIFIDASEPMLEVENTETSFNFTSAGNVAKELVFTTNRDWQVVRGEGDTSWLTIFKREGTAGEGIKVWVAAAENTDTEGRSTSFTLQSAGQTKQFMVYQAQKDAVIISNPDAYKDLPSGRDEETGISEAKIIELELATNAGDFEVVYNFGGSEVEWISLVVPSEDEEEPKTRALENHKLQFEILPNETYITRIATVTVNSKSTDATAQITVSQQGILKPEIKITNESDFKSVSALGTTLPLQLETNVKSLDDLMVLIAEKDQKWVSVAKNADGTAYELTVNANTQSSRSATISVCAAKDYEIKKEMKLTQAAAAGVTITITNKDDFDKELDKLGATVIVKHQIDAATPSWDVEVSYPEGESQDWLEIKNKTAPNAIYLSMSENLVFKPRTATITIYDTANPNSKDEITVEQAAATCMVIAEGRTLSQTIVDYEQDETTLERIELKGELGDADWTLLRTMTNNYKLKNVDLSAVTNEELPEDLDGGATNRKAVFKNCAKLETLIFPQHGKLKSIPGEMCRNCSALKEVRIPKGEEEIGNHAFAACSNVTKIYLPSTMTYLYGPCFEKLTKLEELHLRCKPLQRIHVLRSSVQPGSISETFMNMNDKNRSAKYYLPSAYIDYYKNPTPQNCVSKILQSELDKGEWTTTCQKAWFTWPNDKATFYAEEEWDFE